VQGLSDMEFVKALIKSAKVACTPMSVSFRVHECLPKDGVVRLLRRLRGAESATVPVETQSVLPWSLCAYLVSGSDSWCFPPPMLHLARCYTGGACSRFSIAQPAPRRALSCLQSARRGNG
jgi:hypothetical protein